MGATTLTLKKGWRRMGSERHDLELAKDISTYFSDNSLTVPRPKFMCRPHPSEFGTLEIRSLVGNRGYVISYGSSSRSPEREVKTVKEEYTNVANKTMVDLLFVDYRKDKAGFSWRRI